ncbi:MAG: 4-hydroxy-3-methylbut-2-enyl diphosphate reductase [Rhodothermales bacterium]|nr:4-hydroxy-3-methylbut-2-enyl diphosphate reductase [Rhodothermales bacterium]
MARQFDVPEFFRSPVVSRVKEFRRVQDPRKKDLSPTVLDFGPVRFKLARHFGFCYGVENAIEIAYRALREHPDRRIFLLSEMIHNSHVNDDLQDRGIRFLRTTTGEEIIPLSELASDDIVIIPAFGTTLEMEKALADIGVDVQSYNTTCPFVEKVWKRSDQIGGQDYTVVVHGKRHHEETRATFSHAAAVTPVVVVRDIDEARDLASVIRGEQSRDFFFERFTDRHTEGFDPDRDLERIGVVNQTTMLATETAEIASLLRTAMIDRYGDDAPGKHFADTSDTLCYATNENQDATRTLIDDGADLAVVVGGSNSSNTSHLVELCEEVMPTWFVSGPECLHGPHRIEHFDLHIGSYKMTENWLPDRLTEALNENERADLEPVDILLTAGASCPDSLLEDVMAEILSWLPHARSSEEVLAELGPVTA